MSVLICASLGLDTEIIEVECVCMYRKDDYLAVKILIRNKLKKNNNPSVEWFGNLVHLCVLVGCFLPQEQEKFELSAL